MKKSEKLLDAIGQIDDRIVEEAAESGVKKKRISPKRKILRWQGALAACAVLAICVGIVGVLNRSGLLWGYGTKEAAPEEMAGQGVDTEREMSMEQTAAEAVPEEAASGETFGITADTAAADMAEAGALEQGSGAAGAEEQKRNAEEASLSETANWGEDASGENAVQDRGNASKGPENAVKQESAAGEDPGASVRAVVKESSAESVTYVVENNTDRTITYGRAFSLEKLTDGSWQEVMPEQKVVWTLELLVLDPGSSAEFTVNLGFYGTLPAGQYRLVKSYQIDTGKEPEEYANYPLYVEFTVSE